MLHPNEWNSWWMESFTSKKTHPSCQLVIWDPGSPTNVPWVKKHPRKRTNDNGKPIHLKMVVSYWKWWFSIVICQDSCSSPRGSTNTMQSPLRPMDVGQRVIEWLIHHPRSRIAAKVFCNEIAVGFSEEVVNRYKCYSVPDFYCWLVFIFSSGGVPSNTWPRGIREHQWGRKFSREKCTL